MSVYSSLEKFYNIVFDQCFSPNGSHLATCDNLGQLAVFSLSSALSVSPTSEKKPSKLLKKGHPGPAYCLKNVGPLLVSGGAEDIRAWKWEQLLSSSKDTQPQLLLTPPVGRFGTPETNGMAYNHQSNNLFTGGGDNNIHAWDVETGKLKASYSGHKDYVHCVCLRSGSCQFVSGAEDGTVRIWDPSSSKNPVHVIKPEESGQWIGCVAVDSSGEWLVCGGSAAPSIYHLGSLTKTSSLPVPKGVVTQSAIFAKERVNDYLSHSAKEVASSPGPTRRVWPGDEATKEIITVGSEPFVRHWSVNAEPLAEVPCGHGHAFSAAFNTGAQEYEVLTVSGDSADIHLFTNFGYKAVSLTVTA